MNESRYEDAAESVHNLTAAQIRGASSHFQCIGIVLLHKVQLGKRKDASNILLAITLVPCCLLELSLCSFEIILQACASLSA